MEARTRLVTARELSYRYGTAETGRNVLHNIALDIRAGEVVLLTGPSGSGKTTLLTLIGSLRQPQQGTLQVLGVDLLRASPGQLRQLRQDIRFVYQRHNLLHSLTVLQNVTACMPNTPASGRAANRQRAIEMLDHLGLIEKIHEKPEQLSGGQQQRVAVARALVSSPALLLADEPTASLDREAGQRVASGVCAIIPGPLTFRSLVNHFGSAHAALERLPDLARRGGASRPGRICGEADARAELAASARIGVHLIAPGEAGYPPRLAVLDDAPPLLGVRGALEVLMRPVIAIVGSRNASGAGLKFAATLARDLGEAGFVIASGLARGIDQSAHRASLTSGTMAVLAGGHDKIYPPEHQELLASIIDAGGAAISEMPLGHVPRARDFPRRNRLISGVALGVVVVEAAHRSGSLITARIAAEQGREVFAVPGSPLDPRAAGTNDLIKQGATLTTEASDVINAVEPIMGRPIELREPDGDEPLEIDPAASDRARIVDLLGPSPIGLDDLIRMAGTSPAVVRTVLLELELAGRLERHGGGLVSLIYS